MIVNERVELSRESKSMSCAGQAIAPSLGWGADPASAVPSQSPHGDEETQRLVTLATAGDLHAFNQLVEQTQGMAYQIAYRLLQSEAGAADAVQESYIKAYRGLAAYRGGSFKSWLLRIVTNSCYDQLRQQQRRPTTSFDDFPVDSEDLTPLIDPREGPETHAERMELRHWLERGIAALPLEQRAVVILSDIEGYSYQEIAEITGFAMGTVKSRLSRGRIRLRDFLVRHQVLTV